MVPKKIIIVGASSGIGRQLAKLYAEHNCLVGITARRQHLLEELKLAYPNNIITQCFDVTGPDNPHHLNKLIQQLGGLDLFIYNAGFGKACTELVWSNENTSIKTNVNGFAEMVVYAFNYFLQKGQGQIAFTSSFAALKGNSWAPSYSAGKAFMSNYGEGLNIKAKKLKKDIIITDVRPGFMNTKKINIEHRFWIADPQKAARQIMTAIEKKKRIVYITKRWGLLAKLFKWLPFGIYRHFG